MWIPCGGSNRQCNSDVLNCQSTNRLKLLSHWPHSSGFRTMRLVSCQLSLLSLAWCCQAFRLLSIANYPARYPARVFWSIGNEFSCDRPKNSNEWIPCGGWNPYSINPYCQVSAIFAKHMCPIDHIGQTCQRYKLLAVSSFSCGHSELGSSSDTFFVRGKTKN